MNEKKLSTRRVSKDLGKKLTSPETGEVIYFIDKHHGIKRGLMSRMNFRTLHPTEPNMCQINLTLKLID